MKHVNVPANLLSASNSISYIKEIELEI